MAEYGTSLLPPSALRLGRNNGPSVTASLAQTIHSAETILASDHP